MEMLLVKFEQRIPENGRVEALRITGWKDKEKTIPDNIIPDSDTQIVKDKIPWSTNEDILSQYAKFSVPIILLAETDFPNVLKTMTAREAVETAWRICKRQNWDFTIRNLYAVLNNLNMDLGYA